MQHVCLFFLKNQVATAHVIFEKFSEKLEKDCEEIIFNTVFSGDLSVKKGENDLLIMNFPQNPPTSVELDSKVKQLLADVMKFSVNSILDTQYCKKTQKLLVVLDKQSLIFFC
jgi:hypothetical protein